jgi:hypothetical protein
MKFTEFKDGELKITLTDNPAPLISLPKESDISHDEVCDFLADPRWLWQSVSMDGVSEPNPYQGNRLGFVELRENELHLEQVEQAILFSVETQNINDLGQIFFDQITSHARYIIKKERES